MILEVKGLRKVYRGRGDSTEALKALDLSVTPGEILGLLGPNGAGKTTAVKLIMGFIRPSAGEIRFAGRLLAPAQPRVNIGYLPESFRPNPNLTVGEYVRFQCRMAGDGKASDPEAVKHLLDLVGMKPFARRRISDLSKGMGQRVGLAQAFAGQPDMLILDEPTSGLDPLGKSDVIDLLLEMKAAGKTIFFCSHILSEVRRLCDRIGILLGGELRFLGPVETFLEKWQETSLERAFKQEALCAPS